MTRAVVRRELCETAAHDVDQGTVQSEHRGYNEYKATASCAQIAREIQQVGEMSEL